MDRLSARGALPPALLCLLVVGAYLAFFVARERQPEGAQAFIVQGTSNTPGNRGYDGQYYYRIAVDPLAGRHGLDRPAYRYQRIGYPLAARLLAFGQRLRIPTTLVLVNVIAIGLGVLTLGLLLRRNGLSPLYALPYAVYVGQVASFWRDLAEPLAFLLVALALLLLRPDRVWPAALLLLLAALTKETALLFAIALALHLLLRRRIGLLLQVLLLVALPYALWQAALWLALGYTGVVGADSPPSLPLGGLAGARGVRQLLFDLTTVVLPALLCLWLAWQGLTDMWAIARLHLPSPIHWRQPAFQAVSEFPTLALLANLAFVLWLPARSYADLWASGRNADGLVLAALTYPALAATRLRWMLAVLWSAGAPLLWLQ